MEKINYNMKHLEKLILNSIDIIQDFVKDYKEELMWDTISKAAPGGQHVVTSHRGVRLTHIPTGIATECNYFRSQHSNRNGAALLLMFKFEE